MADKGLCIKCIRLRGKGDQGSGSGGNESRSLMVPPWLTVLGSD